MSFMYVTATKLKEVPCFTRINKEFHIHILHGGISLYKAGTILVVYSAVYLLHCQIAPYTLTHLDLGYGLCCKFPQTMTPIAEFSSLVPHLNHD